MSCSRMLANLSFELQTYSTGTQYAMGQQWLAVDDAAELGFAMNIMHIGGNIEVKPCVQLADVRKDMPDAAAAISAGSFISTTGFTHYRETSAGGTAKLLARVGVAYKNSTGTNMGACQVQLTTAVKTCIRMLPAHTIDVQPGMLTDTDTNYTPISGFLPAADLSKVKAAFMQIDSANVYCDYQLAMRGAVDPRAPGSWYDVEATYTTSSTGNSERNTGELSAPAGVGITSQMLFQLGVAFKNNSGSSNPRLQIVSIPAVLYA